MKNHSYIGNCVGNPFLSVSALQDVIDRGREITRKTFLQHCETEYSPEFYLNPEDMRAFPNDFRFFKSSYKGKTVYYFTHSAIEYFYMKGRDS